LSKALSTPNNYMDGRCNILNVRIFTLFSYVTVRHSRRISNTAQQNDYVSTLSVAAEAALTVIHR